MARIILSSPEAKQLADELSQGYLLLGNVSALTEELNNSLRESGEGEVIYPNRIHTLLSGDGTKSINRSTFEVVQKAAKALLKKHSSSAAPIDEKHGALLMEIQRRWQASSKETETVKHIGEALSIPAAIVRQLLVHKGLYTEGVSLAPAAAKTTKSAGPDWSYQDTARIECLRALRSGPNKKVGLIIPTGGGKTRTALSIALEVLASNDAGKIIWVTHRQNLRAQAHRELQKMLSNANGGKIPANAAELLASRFEFIMVSRLPEYLRPETPPLLVIVDEAHHAAAPSYEPIFKVPYPVRGLFLTATPIREDGLPIGIDEVAYTITFRELCERGTILRPEFEEFPVEDFDWSPGAIKELAEHVVLRATDDYQKTIVIAPRVERVDEFYQALVTALAECSNHPLSIDDIGYVHSKGNSIGCSSEDFLSIFAGKPRGIIVSAQMLLEGFDDPSVNAVVMTYPSSSRIILMQAAGRCVRYAPGKQKAYVLQSRNDRIAYHFDNRWLYNEISDFLRPELVEVEYQDHKELLEKTEDILRTYKVNSKVAKRILDQVRETGASTHCRIMLSGLPYFGTKSSFTKEAEWSAILETAQNSIIFRELFNRFSALGAQSGDPTPFLDRYGLAHGIEKSFAAGSDYRLYSDLLLSMHWARKEQLGSSDVPGQHNRNYTANGPTSWLKYFTFRYRPAIAPALDEFLSDCYNKEELVNELLLQPAKYKLIVKTPLPLGGYEGHLLGQDKAEQFQSVRTQAIEALSKVKLHEQYAVLAGFMATLPAAALPVVMLSRIEQYLPKHQYESLTFSLNNN